MNRTYKRKEGENAILKQKIKKAYDLNIEMGHETVLFAKEIKKDENEDVKNYRQKMFRLLMKQTSELECAEAY